MAMEMYHDTAQDAQGNIINGAQVTVTVHSTGAVATIFDKDDNPLSNPFLSGYDRSAGEIDFKAADGLYDITVVGDTTTIIKAVSLVGGIPNITPAGLALLDDADAAEQRDTLGLGTAATQNLNTMPTVTMAGAINTARGAVAMHATDMDLWAQPNIIDGTGSAVTITAIVDAPQAGATRTLYPPAGTVITNNAMFSVEGGVDYTTLAGDALVFEAKSTNTYNVRVLEKVGGITFATQAENEAGTVENKAVDPLGVREAFNATGSAPVYACRAWVNFNGTGTVAIRASGNVSSVTDNGLGNYTVNFATAMPDTNYEASLSSTLTIGTRQGGVTCSEAGRGTGSIRIYTSNSAAAAQDHASINVAIFR